MATSQTNDESQIIPEHERHLVHVRLENKQFDTKSGEKLSTPFNQSYTVPEFKQAKESGALTGYSVEVLSHPDNFKVDLSEPKKMTGPLLGQAGNSQGVEGSAATTAGETLLQTTGSLESSEIAKNAGNATMGISAEGDATGNAPATGETGSTTATGSTTETNSNTTETAKSQEGLTPKQKLQATYKEVVGQEPDNTMTMVELQAAIDAARK